MFHAPYFQIVCTVALQMLVLVYLAHAKPYQNRKTNIQEFFNEVLNLIFTYHLFLFTGFVPDPETKWGVGTSAITILIVYMAVNLTIVFVEGCITLYNHCKMKRKKKEM